MKIAAILFPLFALAFAESTLSHTNILMPLLFDNRSIQYTLTAFDGCYSWTSSQPAFLAVHQLPLPDCLQSQASVTVLANQPVNQIIWISAKKENSNKELRVEATIDSIHRLEILTKQKVIDLDTFEELQIRAYDRDNNTFSTVEGIRFLWKSQTEDVQLVPLHESELQVSNTRLEVEKAGFHSDVMVVKGTRVGRSVIQVILQEQKYSSSISASVEIVVIEKFTLIPNRQLYYLPTHSSIHFDLYLIKAKYFKKIQLADDSYKWFVTSEISKISQNGVLTTKHIEQQHTLTIRNTTENSVSVFYVVVEPKSLGLEIIDNEFVESVEQQFYKNVFANNVTALVVNREYTLKGYLRDSDKNYIYSQALIKYHNSQMLIYSNDQIKSKEIRKGVIITVSDEKLSTNAEIQFVNPIRLITPYEYIHLPVGEVYTLMIVEGSGEYEVYSKNGYVASVNGNQISGVHIGKCILVIRDKFNFYNQILIEVIVTHMSFFFPLEKRKEVINSIEDKAYMIGQGVINGTLRNYTQCHSIKFESEKEQSVVYNENLVDMKTSLRTLIHNQDMKFKALLMSNNIEEIYDTFGVCSGVVFKHRKSGEHIMDIRYDQQINIMNLRVYDLMSINVNKLILTPYSSYTILLNGGPRIWDSQIRNTLSNGIIKLRENEYNVICEESGNRFKLSKQNEATLLLPGPKLMDLNLNVQCILPHYFKIFNSETKEEIKWIYMGEQIQIYPEAYLDEHSKFNNFSSLYLNWQANSPLEYNQGYLKAVSNGDTQGKLIINTQRYIDNYASFTLIQSEFILAVYQPIRIVPESAILLINQDKEFQIVDGSGNYECNYQGVRIDCEQSKIKIIAKNISSDWIEVKDLNIHSRTKAKIDVVNPNLLLLKIDQKYVIVGKSVNSTVELKYGEHIFKSIEQIKLITDLDKKQLQDIFTLTPQKLGEHKIYAQWNEILKSDTQTLKTISEIKANPPILYMTNGCTGFIELTKYEYPSLDYTTNTQINGLSITIRENYLLIDATNFKLKGDYPIKVQLINNKIEIGSITVKIVIGNLDKVDILYGDRVIDLQSTVRLLAAPYINKQHPMCLCLCNFSFTWFLDNQEVLSAQDQYGYSLHAEKERLLIVKVEVQGVSAETKITIVKPHQLEHKLYVNIQEQYKRPLLLPFGCTYKFKSDIEISPCTSDHTTITLKESNSIYAATSESKIPTQVKYKNQYIQFEVKNVYQIFLQQDILILKESDKLSVDLLNEQGQMFESCREEQIQIVSYTPFIFDVKLSENTLDLKSKELGKALLKVQYIKKPEIYNYLLIRVGAVIQPNQIQVYLGSQVQFTVPSPQPGKWQSNCGTFDNDILTTTKEGNCRVQYNETGLSFDGIIEVIQPYKLEIESTGKDGFLKLEINLYPVIQKHEKVKRIQKMECEVENKDWFEVSSIDEKQLICIIKPINSLQWNTPIQKNVKVNLKVSNNQFSVTNSAYVGLEREIIIPQKTIELTENNKIQTLRIPTYEQPVVKVDHSIIHFCTTQFDNIKNEYLITINVSQQIQDGVEGRIWFLQNGQQILDKSILVRYDPNGNQWGTMDMMLVASGLSIIFLIYFKYFSP